MGGRKEEGGKEDDDGGREKMALCDNNDTVRLNPFNPTTSDDVETQISIL